MGTVLLHHRRYAVRGAADRRCGAYRCNHDIGYTAATVVATWPGPSDVFSAEGGQAMTRTVSASVLSSVLVLVPAPGWCAASLERYVLAIGANLGGANRPPLLYAVSDAERFARVMIDIGGVAAPHEILLKQPKLHAVWAVHDRRGGRHARPRVPHLERGNRSGAGIRSHPGIVLHALPDLRVPWCCGCVT